MEKPDEPPETTGAGAGAMTGGDSRLLRGVVGLPSPPVASVGAFIAETGAYAAASGGCVDKAEEGVGWSVRF